MMYVGIALLLAIGLYGLLAKRHVVKKILALAVLDNAVNLFLVALGYREGKGPPILMPDADPATFVGASVDPIPRPWSSPPSSSAWGSRCSWWP